MESAIAGGRPSHRQGYVGLALVALLPLGVALACQVVAPAEGTVAAVFPPWWDGGRSFAAAGVAGPVVRLGAVPFVVIVGARDRARLHAAGAWLLLDPRVLGACAAVNQAEARAS